MLASPVTTAIPVGMKCAKDVALEQYRLKKTVFLFFFFLLRDCLCCAHTHEYKKKYVFSSFFLHFYFPLIFLDSHYQERYISTRHWIKLSTSRLRFRFATEDASSVGDVSISRAPSSARNAKPWAPCVDISAHVWETSGGQKYPQSSPQRRSLSRFLWGVKAWLSDHPIIASKIVTH